MKNPIDNAIAKIDAEIATLNNVRARLEAERNAVPAEEPAAPKVRKARKKRGMPAAEAAPATPAGNLI